MSETEAKTLLLSSAAKKTTQQTDTGLKRFVIKHPADIKLPYLTTNAYTRNINATQNATFADLTVEQATHIKNLLGATGAIKVNGVMNKLTPTTQSTPDFTVAATATPTYAVAPATCSTITISSEFVAFFLDSMVDKTKFPNVNLSIGTNYSGNPTPCDPHAQLYLGYFRASIRG